MAVPVLLLLQMRGPRMLTLAIALLGALFFAQRFEGTIRVKSVFFGVTFAAFGRVQFHARTWKPGRVYVRLEIAG